MRCEDAKHLIVCRKSGRYAGWPANQGIWSWGDEILVGFVLGHTAGRIERGKWRFGHQIDTSRPMRHVFARSLDGGEKWSIEDGENHGRTAPTYDHFDLIYGNVLRGIREQKSDDETDHVDFMSDGFAAAFVRETNHVGPTHFYLSNDRGQWWCGPYVFPDLGLPGIASRTDYVVLGKRSMLAMLTVAKENGREGRVLCVRTGDGGVTWERLGWVCEGTADGFADGFAIMPSTVRLDDGTLVSAVRCCDGTGGRKEHWIDLYASNDEGENWGPRGTPVEDTGRSGGPGALVGLSDGRLVLVYAVRVPMRSGKSRLCCKVSGDGGSTWGDEIVLREDGRGWDLGYPTAVQRPDGSVVAVYYWVDEEMWPDRYIGATVWKP